MYLGAVLDEWANGGDGSGLPISPWENEFDYDLDGYSPFEGDCDDDNPCIHPGADEIWGNYIDEDCDGYYVEADGNMVYISDYPLRTNAPKEEEYSIYPNPISASQNLYLNSSNEQTGFIYIISSEGKIVVSQQINQGTNIIAIDKLAKGTYVVKDDNGFVEKIQVL